MSAQTMVIKTNKKKNDWHLTLALTDKLDGELLGIMNHDKFIK